jgi:hypothetical protein
LEAHAQNTLFAFDDNFEMMGIIAKDAESIDKDISLISDLGLAVEIRTCPYKCLTRESYNYHIMHSFMFDFKLGEYLVNPIIQDALHSFDFDEEILTERIRDYNRKFIRKLPKDFFPLDGKWYSYKNVVHNRNKPRKYIAKDNPRFR